MSAPAVTRGAAVGLAVVIAIATPLVVKWEGKRNEVYLDGGNVPTVCYGHTGPDVQMGQPRRSDAECERLLERDLDHHARGLRTCLRNDAPKHLQGAFASWTYNVGVGAVCRSTAVRLANAGDYAGACKQLLRWNKDNGFVVRGLVRRRDDERGVCDRSLLNGAA